MKKYILIILGSLLLSFGIYNIHYQCGLSEGGELGLELLLKHFFNISPAITSFVFDLFFLILGTFIIKNKFAIKALLGTITYSISYYIFELFPPIFPDFSEKMLLGSVIGALFVGIGSGLVVKMGGASGGDDSLSMILSKISGLQIAACYFIFDFIIILLSLSYISFDKIIYSFITALLSSIIIGIVQKIKIE